MFGRMMIGLAFPGLLALIVGAAPAAAGSGSPDTADCSGARGLAGELQGQSRVRVLGFAPGDTLVLESPRLVGCTLQGSLAGRPDSLVTLELSAIRRLDRRVSSVGRVALGGGVIGAALGGMAGIAAADFCIFGDCPEPTAGEYLGAGLEGLAIGAVIGGAAGALLGAPFHRWSRFYPGEGAGEAPAAIGGRPAASRDAGRRPPGPTLVLKSLRGGAGVGVEFPLGH